MGQEGHAPQTAVAATTQTSMRWVEREFLLSTPSAPRGLDVLEVAIERPGRHPLALLTHGTASNPVQRATLTPWSLLPEALWFARRGYVVLVIVRRGYGRSDGRSDTETNACLYGANAFERSGREGAEDLRAAIDYAADKLPQADTSRVVSAGVSSGGFAEVALTADPPPGLKAAVNFAGGRGGDGNQNNCNLHGILSAFQRFGKSSKTPMLWIYSENDRWFPPGMAHQFEQAFQKTGGKDQFVLAPAYQQDGHLLFNDVSAWSATVEKYLEERGMDVPNELLPEPPVPNILAPAGLGSTGNHAFHDFLLWGPAKAFATDDHGTWGMSTGQWDQFTADSIALKLCEDALRPDQPSCFGFSRGR